MKYRESYKHEQVWHWAELQKLAEEIKRRVAGVKPVTLAEYISYADDRKREEIGALPLWITAKEPKMQEFFPDAVYSSLCGKAGERLVFGDAEIELLRKNSGRGLDWLCSFFYLDRRQIRRRAIRYGVSVPGLVYKYSDEEISLIRKVGYKASVKSLARTLKRPEAGVRDERRKLLGPKFKRFIWDEHPRALKFLIANYSRMTYEQLAARIGVDKWRVQNKLRFLCLKKKRYFSWAKHPEKLQYLAEHLGGKSGKIATKLGIPARIVVSKKYLLKKAGDADFQTKL